MKIALLSTNFDLGGAAIVTRRLTDALRDAGHDARMIVARPGNASLDDSSVICIEKSKWHRPFLTERAELWLKGVKRRDVFKVSTGRYGVGLENHPFIAEADAVFVNWASQGFLSLDSLAKILATGKPVVYTMHDLWPATSLCHLPGDCPHYFDGSDCSICPYFKGKKGLKGAALRKEIVEMKRQIFANENLRLVAVSNWQRNQALKSSILCNKEISVIPHPFPIDLYQPGVKTDAEGKRIIVMAAARLDDPVKDLPAAIDALNTFAWEYPTDAEGVEVAFVGSLNDASELKRLRIPYKHLGMLSSDQLRELYARATVVISSSKYETMGATLMEGMAAGAIPVTYGDAGQTDIVTDAENGFIAPSHTPASLAFALSLAFQTARAIDAINVSSDATATEPFTPAFLHNEVARRFSPATIAERYISLIKR